jgi:hypothetical protein
MDNVRLHMLHLRISINQYHFLKFILEGYDGLAVLSKKEGDIVLLRYPFEMHSELLQILSSIGKRICLCKNHENGLSIYSNV